MRAHSSLPDATIHHILNGSRHAGPEVCNALARALDEPPERVFRLAGCCRPGPFDHTSRINSPPAPYPAVLERLWDKTPN